MVMIRSELEHIDKQHIWHPFTQHNVWDSEPILIFERGEGNELIDVSGKRYLDGISSLWCNVHGHAEPRLLAALHQQVDSLCHATLLGSSHQPIIELTAELLPHLPPGLSRVFYCDGGSVAVEAALRMAVEFWQKQSNETLRRKKKLVSLSNGYHGDTLGSVGLGYLDIFHQHVQAVVVPSIKIDPPHVFRFYRGMSDSESVRASLEVLEKLFVEQGAEIAALVIEPVVQGAAGIWIQPLEFVRGVERLCRAHGVLLICDEIATGFGKTGAMFASQLTGVTPDLMTMGKGLSAGYLPIAAVAATEEIFSAFRGAPEERKTFFFGQTFSGNPLAARVSTENLRLFRQRAVVESIPAKAEKLASLLAEQIAPCPYVDEIRQLGLMAGIELTSIPGGREAYPVNDLVGHRIALAARERGVIIRPLGNVMVLMPSLSFSNSESEQLVSVLRESLIAVCGA